MMDEITQPEAFNKLHERLGTFDGGSIFPDPGRAQSAKQRETLTDKGMSLRDYFAARAMQAHVQAAWNNPGPSNESFTLSAEENFYSWIAKKAYLQADAMLMARKVNDE